MMTRFFAFFILFLTTTLISVAQPASYAPTAEENSLLWEISGKSLEEPSYLYGTIHMINKEDFFLTESLKQSLQASDQVTFEINLENMFDFATLMPLMMKALMNDGTTLRDLFTEEEYQQVKEYFEPMGLPMMFMDRIKPMFLSVIDPQQMMAFSTEESQEVVSYEMELMEMAKAGNKKIGGLETAEMQMSMLTDSIPYDVQARMLLESINSDDAEKDDQLRQLVERYKAQDLYGLTTLLAGDPDNLGEYEELLLERRNRNWIPIMETMMQQSPTLFAVGAGHLGGETGVIALLREQGYTVRPLREEK